MNKGTLGEIPDNRKIIVESKKNHKNKVTIKNNFMKAGLSLMTNNLSNKTMEVALRPRTSARIIELYLWLALALIISGPQIYFWINYNDPRYFFDNYTNFLFSIFIFIFPVLYKLIFGYLPLETIRRRRTLLKDNPKQFLKSESIQEIQVSESINSSVDANVELFLIDQIKESSEIANKIFLRSGAYLLIGCLIAFGGVMIFLYYGSFGDQKSYDFQSLMIQFLPKLGSLFFVEFIAIFFLKQSKIMMEEYRYYDKLKRIRQDNFSIIKIVKDQHNGNTDVEAILKYCNFESNSRFLAKDETTEILEAQRLLNEERNPLEKIIELVKIVKAK